MNTIDIHVHHRWHDPGQPRPDFAIDRMKELAKNSGIRSVLLLTTALDKSPEELRTRNSATVKLMEEDPDFFLGACYLSPKHDPEFIQQEAARCARAGFVAIKQHMDLPADDPRQDPISEAAAELDIPILWHAWYKMAQKFPNESDASNVARLARRHPNTRYIMAHLTGVGRRGVQDVADLPNVWVDTSGGFAASEIVEYAVRYLGVDRVLYGSDYTAGRDFAAQVGRVYGADLPDGDREKILWKNASALLKLGRSENE